MAVIVRATGKHREASTVGTVTHEATPVLFGGTVVTVLGQPRYVGSCVSRGQAIDTVVVNLAQLHGGSTTSLPDPQHPCVHGCIGPWMGQSPLGYGDDSERDLVKGTESVVYHYKGTDGSMIGIEALCRSSEGTVGVVSNGQFESSGLCQQAGRQEDNESVLHHAATVHMAGGEQDSYPSVSHSISSHRVVAVATSV